MCPVHYLSDAMLAKSFGGLKAIDVIWKNKLILYVTQQMIHYHSAKNLSLISTGCIMVGAQTFIPLSGKSNLWAMAYLILKPTPASQWSPLERLFQKYGQFQES